LEPGKQVEKIRTTPITLSEDTSGNLSIFESKNQAPISSRTSGKAYAPQPIQRLKKFVQTSVRPPELAVKRLRRVSKPMTIITIPAISTFLSAERGVGAGWVVFCGELQFW